MNGIIHSFWIHYPFICENDVSDFSCGGLITLLPLALTPFKTKGSTLKYARFFKIAGFVSGKDIVKCYCIEV